MMTNFIITLSLFWPLPREGLSRFSVLLKSVAYLLKRGELFDTDLHFI